MVNVTASLHICLCHCYDPHPPSTPCVVVIHSCCCCRLQIGQFDQMAARISAAVQQNCGQKAIILAHSLGMNVVLRMLREPRFQSWR